MESGRALQSGRQAREQGTDLGGRCPSPSRQEAVPRLSTQGGLCPFGCDRGPSRPDSPSPLGESAEAWASVCSPACVPSPASTSCELRPPNPSCVPPTRTVLSRALTGARGKTRPPSSAMTPAHRGAGRVKLVTIYRLYSRAWPGVNPRREFALLGIRDMAERRN